MKPTVRVGNVPHKRETRPMASARLSVVGLVRGMKRGISDGYFRNDSLPVDAPTSRRTEVPFTVPNEFE